MEAIQGRRSSKKVPGGRSLHEYVNLYINGRNVMLSKMLYGTSIDEVCVLRVSSDVVDLPHVVQMLPLDSPSSNATPVFAQY